MFFRRLFRQEIGQPISASTINRIADAAEYANKLRGAAPLNIKHTPGGPLVGMLPLASRLAVANGNIPARSGTAAGVGSVFIVTQQCTFSGGAMTGCTLATSSVAIPVYNPWSGTQTSGNGVDSGQYCWIQQDLSGFYCVFPGECV